MTTLPSVTDANYPTHAEIRDGILRTIRYGYARRGMTANVLEGSALWYRADAIARRVTIAIANNQIANTARSPLEAQGDDLITLAAVFGVPPRPASFATGYVGIRCTGTVTVPLGYVYTGPGGRKYKTSAAATSVTSGATILSEALTAGKASNLAAGTEVTWDSASVGGLDHRATIAAGGIDDGADADDVETVRARLIDRLSFPAVGNNWAMTKAAAEGASAAVAVAFVYPAVRGGSSEDVAIVGSEGDGVLSTAIVNLVSAAILSGMGGNPSLNVTGIVNQEMDVILAASLPLPESAGGAGGGWLDPVPWPSGNAQITSYNLTTGSFSVTASSAPTVGNHIGVWNPDAAEMVERVILTVSGSGPWTVTVQDGLGFNALGAYVSAGAEHLASYAATAFTEFAKLGPGEKTTSTDILPRGRRHPSTDIAYPSDLARTILGAITRSHTEILDLDYAARYETGTTTTRTSPSIPSTTADPPRRLRVMHFAIRKA